jgi:hypothetical protein
VAVVARISGGLGNQMFQYAAARRLAIENDLHLKLDTISGFRRDETFKRQYLLNRFNINVGIASRIESFSFPGSETVRTFVRLLNRLLPYKNRFYVEEEGFKKPRNCFDSRVVRIRNRKILFMEGNWQSEKYFASSSKIIRSELTLKPLAGNGGDAVAGVSRGRHTVAVGVRSYSEVPSGARHYHVRLGAAYYSRAMGLMASRLADAEFVVFCDNVEWARRVLPKEFPVRFIPPAEGNEGAIFDFQQMTRCRHFIVSNGSFHWWGAWMGDHPDKIVIAPSSGLNNCDMIPEDWIKVDIG